MQKNQAAAAATSASRRAILLGAGAASSLALAPIAPAFAADAHRLDLVGQKHVDEWQQLGQVAITLA